MTHDALSAPVDGRRDFSRLLAIALLGPGVGAVFMLFVLLAMTGLTNEPDFWVVLFSFSIFVLIIGYMAGFIPSIVSAIVWHFVIARIGRPALRIVLSLVTGAVTGSLLVWPAIVLMFGHYAPDATFYIWSAAAGAIALLATAQPWRPQS